MSVWQGVLPQEEINFYRRNGYLIVEGVLSEGECDHLYTVLKKYADENFSAILNLDRGLLGQTRVDPADAALVRGVMAHPRAVAILDTLQGAEVVALMSQVLFKEAASGYAEQAWNPHQDNSYPRARHGAYITTNFFLADADPENGSLYIFPGSHQEGLLACVPTISYHEIPGTNPGNTVQVPEKYPKVDLYFKKGSMLVLHGDVVHGSYPNRSARSRPLLSVSYITRGEDFIPGASANRMAIEVH